MLDSALAYHREVTRQSSEMPEAVENLLPRLQVLEFNPSALPALAIDGKVVTAGTLPSPTEIKQLIEQSQTLESQS